MSYNYRLLSTFLPYQPENFPPALELEENNNEVSIFYMQDLGILFIEPEKDPVGGSHPVLALFVSYSLTLILKIPCINESFHSAFTAYDMG